MPKSSYASFNEEKYHSAFARVLREELLKTPEDVKELADFLQISPQAVNQFKQGQSFPKTENLVKIARHYDCSLDYLIGLSDVRSPDADIQAVCDYTGLPDAAIESLHAGAEKVKEKQEQGLPQTPMEFWMKTLARLIVERPDLLSDIGKYLYTDFSGFITDSYDPECPLEFDLDHTVDKVWVRTIWSRMIQAMPMTSDDAEELLILRIQKKLRDLRAHRE